MRLDYVALVTVVALLSVLDTFSGTVDASAQISSPITNAASTGRLMRVDKTVHDDNDSDERGGFSSVMDKISTKFFKKALMKSWVEADKSDDFVKKVLKLDNLPENALKSHKNVKYYEQFVDKAETKKVNDWLTGDVSTYDAWVKLGLKHADDIDEALKTGAFKTYIRFVKAYDGQAIALWRGFGTPLPRIAGDSPREMTARMDVLAATKRDGKYTKQIIELDNLTGTELITHANYKYFEHYQRMVKKLKKPKQILNRLRSIHEV